MQIAKTWFWVFFFNHFQNILFSSKYMPNFKECIFYHGKALTLKNSQTLIWRSELGHVPGSRARQCRLNLYPNSSI